MKYLLLYVSTAIIFFSIDMLWLGVVAKDFYREKLGYLMADNVNWMAAVIFYLLYIGGILYFAIVPGLREGNWQTALIQGALFGFFCYATYDLTNLATLRDWPISVVFVDICWGIVLTGGVAFLSFWAGKKLGLS